MVLKRFFMLLCVVTLGSAIFAQELYASSSNPSADKVAADLIGVQYSETNSGGYFNSHQFYFAEDENLQVVINDYHSYGNELVYDVTVQYTTPTRGSYYVYGEVTYYRSGGQWLFDMFICRSVMPIITNRYWDCVSANLVNDSGVTALMLTNHSNVKLAAYVVVSYGYNGENVTKTAVSIEPNSNRKVGGMFSVDVYDYRIDYIERY